MQKITCIAVALLFFGAVQATEVPFVELEGHTALVGLADFMPDGKQILTASRDESFRIWDAETGKELQKLAPRTGAFWQDAFSPDKKKFVTADRRNKAVRIWDTESGEELQTLGEGEPVDIVSVAFSPVGKKIITSSMGEMNALRIWDAETGKELQRLDPSGTRIRWGYFSPDGKKIVTPCEDKTARIWDVESGKELHTITGHDSFEGIAFSPDGLKIVTANNDVIEDGNDIRIVSFFRIWDAESGKELRAFTELSGSVGSIVFSPDGKKIATTVGDSSTRIRDAESGEILQTLAGVEDFVVFSPDGKIIASAGTGHTVTIWDVESGKELHKLQLGENRHAVAGNSIGIDPNNPKVRVITFSPDGTKIVTASDNGSVRVWALK